MLRWYWEAVPPICAGTLADSMAGHCVMAIFFRSAVGRGHRPRLQKEFFLGPHPTIGGGQQSAILFCPSFAAAIGTALTLQRFNVSRVKRSLSRRIQIEWACVLMAPSSNPRTMSVLSPRQLHPARSKFRLVGSRFYFWEIAKLLAAIRK